MYGTSGRVVHQPSDCRNETTADPGIFNVHQLFFQVLVSNDQADTLMIQHARVLKASSLNRPIYVVSSDYDFLALPGVVSVDALIDVVRRVIIYKRDVLKLLQIGAVDLGHCYCLASCDDIETNLRGIGIKGALAYMKSNVLSIQSLVEIILANLNARN